MKTLSVPAKEKQQTKAFRLRLPFSLQTGIPALELKNLEDSLRQAQNPAPLIRQILKDCPDLAEMALEQGAYQLAWELGLAEPLHQLKALMFSGRKEEASKLVAEQTRIDAVLSAPLRCYDLRLRGKMSEARDVLNKEIMPKLSQWSSDIQGEIFLNAGGLSFGQSEFADAFSAYAEAFQIFEKLNRPGKMAVAAFNCSISLGYLQKNLEAHTWNWRAEEILENFDLPHLRRSMDLSRIEKRIEQKSYLEARVLSEKYLLHNDLSMVQKILALQALSRSCLELGRVLQAEAAAADSRRLVQQFQTTQYETFQRALELDLEFLTGRSLSRPRSLTNVEASDRRAEKEFLIAQIRRFWARQEVQRLAKAVQDLNSLTSDIPEDVQILVLNNTALIPRSLRGFLAQSFVQMGTRRGAGVQLLLENWKSWLSDRPELMSESPLAQGLNSLLMGSVTLSLGQEREAIKFFLEAREVFERGGLERWRGIAFGLAAMVDPHEQNSWISFLNEISTDEKTWLQTYFRRQWGMNILAGRWLLTDEQSHMTTAEAVEQQPNQFDLYLNEIEQVVYLRGQVLPLKGLLLQLLQALVRAPRHEGITKEQLVEKVWQQSYDPLIHDSLIYTSVNRLRDLIEIESIRGSYRLPLNLKVATLAKDNSANSKLNKRQQMILKALDLRNELQRHDIVEAIKVSERTALRELSLLVELGLLEKMGSGRGVSYRKANV